MVSLAVAILSGMRVLVTGGAGFIGSHVVDEALAAGHDVAVLDNFASGKRQNVAAKARVYETDVCDREGVFQVFRHFKPDAVSHQAAQASVSASVRDPLEDARVNVMGGIHVLDAARETGVKAFIFASTGGAIYGEIPEGRRADVSWPPQPESPYACSKCALEYYLRLYRKLYGLNGIALRYSNVYGPRQDPFGEAGVVAIFTSRLMAGQTIQINARKAVGDPGCVRDYVYVRDVARANVAAIAGKIPQPVLNVCTGETTTTLDLATTLEELVGATAEKVFAPPRAGDLERSVLDPREFEEILGRPTGLREGLRKTVEFFRDRK